MLAIVPRHGAKHHHATPGMSATPGQGVEKATWRSGDAADCKSAYPGSIPGVASNFVGGLSRDDAGVHRITAVPVTSGESRGLVLP